MILKDDKINGFELMEMNCQAGLSAKATTSVNNDRTSPTSTATTDNYPSDDHLGKRS